MVCCYNEIPIGEATEIWKSGQPQALKIDMINPVKSRVLFTQIGWQTTPAKARIVCVAGNSIESPRLLLNSFSMFPDGLANSSGQVGRNYMRHMTGSVYVTFDKPVRFRAPRWPYEELMSHVMIHRVDLLVDMMETLLLGFLLWPLFWILALGEENSPPLSINMKYGRYVACGRRHA